MQLLFAKPHNINTRRHSRKLVGNGIKQIKGYIFKQQVVTAATGSAAGKSRSESRKGLDKIRDNESRKKTVKAPCRSTRTPWPSQHRRRRARGAPGTEGGQAGCAQMEPDGLRRWPRRAQLIIHHLPSGKLCSAWSDYIEKFKSLGTLCTQRLTPSGPTTAVPLTPKRREGHSGCSVHRHRALPSASSRSPRVISFRNHPGTSRSLSGQQLQLSRYSRRDKDSPKAPGLRVPQKHKPAGKLWPARVSLPPRSLPAARHAGPGGTAVPLPEPPHVAVLVGEEAVGVIAAVLDVLEAAAVHGAGVAARPRAAEPAHQHLVGVEVAAALGAHGVAAARRAARRLGSGGNRAGGGAASGRSAGRTRRLRWRRRGAGQAAGEARYGREPPRPLTPGVAARRGAAGAARALRWGRDRSSSRPSRGGRRGPCGADRPRGCSPPRQNRSVSRWCSVFPSVVGPASRRDFWGLPSPIGLSGVSAKPKQGGNWEGLHLSWALDPLALWGVKTPHNIQCFWEASLLFFSEGISF